MPVFTSQKGIYILYIHRCEILTMSLCGFFGEILINWNNETIYKNGFFP